MSSLNLQVIFICVCFLVAYTQKIISMSYIPQYKNVSLIYIKQLFTCRILCHSLSPSISRQPKQKDGLEQVHWLLKNSGSGDTLPFCSYSFGKNYSDGCTLMWREKCLPKIITEEGAVNFWWTVSHLGHIRQLLFLLPAACVTEASSEILWQLRHKLAYLHSFFIE